MSIMYDLVGKSYEHFTVIRKATKEEKKNSGSRIIYWYCKCECGNYFISRTNSIVHGITNSCGCIKKTKLSKAQREDLTGQKFGSLTVLYLKQVCKNRQCKWHCLCDCGQEVDVYASNLKRNHTQSCGCERSVGEKVICDILNDRGIQAKRQFIFDDLKGIGGGNLMFDFAFTDDDDNLIALLEYQGIQHYSYTPETAYFGYQQREYTDKAKKEYCKSKQIPLYEIRYDQDIPSALNRILCDIYHDNTVPSGIIPKV